MKKIKAHGAQEAVSHDRHDRRGAINQRKMHRNKLSTQAVDATMDDCFADEEVADSVSEHLRGIGRSRMKKILKGDHR